MKKWLSIPEPLDLHMRIANRGKLTLKLGTFHLLQLILAHNLRDKSWWLFLIRVIDILLCEVNLRSVLLNSSLHLNQRLRLFHALWHLILENDCWLT